MTYNELLSAVADSPKDINTVNKVTNYYKEKYGDDFSLDIAKTDEMFLHFYKVIESIPSDFSDHTRSWLNYFKIGERIYSAIMNLAGHQFSKSKIKVLDFASGYGRVARFFDYKNGAWIIASIEIELFITIGKIWLGDY